MVNWWTSRLVEIDERLPRSGVPDAFTLEVVTQINPEANTALEGLYLSNGMFCTQCEAEGFRRITYYPDRPDVMSIFTTRIIADPGYPVLLSNGNLISNNQMEDGRWGSGLAGSLLKPCYLFALVGGELAQSSATNLSRCLVEKSTCGFMLKKRPSDRVRHAGA